MVKTLTNFPDYLETWHGASKTRGLYVYYFYINDNPGMTMTYFKAWLNLLIILIRCGECGGSVVERRTPEREVWGSKPTSAVQDTLLPESTGNTCRKRCLPPDMTEKLLPGTLRLNTNKTFTMPR